MAAMRSALAMFSRRSCGSGGSSVAASMGRRGLEIYQVCGAAAPRMPPLHPTAVRNLESWRCMTTGRGEPTVKAGSTLRKWWQRAKDRAENAGEEEKARAFFVYSLVTLGTPAVYVFKSSRG
ncbi:hypothetical protein QOZ80_4AG0304260 [Eleusine coracana subsp. coracana]|nr:hypothetical protein QOZ80_4AG0304260 [Eleusine coracana subsp. coracana]